MPDMTLCLDKTCPMANNCYRFKATPDPLRQSYFTETVRDGDHCAYYLPDRKRRKS